MKITTFAASAVLCLAIFGVRSAHAAIYMEYEPIKGESVVGQSFTLDASKSQDDGITGKFLWTQVSGPAVTISGEDAQRASFVPSVPGTYVFDLSVTDANGRATNARQVEVVVSADESSPQEASDALLKFDTIKGESTKGAVQQEFKVEKGESAPSIEPDEIDVTDSKSTTQNFYILFEGRNPEQSEEGRSQIADILLRGAKEAGMPAEQISLNYEKIETRVRHPVKLFGIIPISTTATVEIDAKERVKVRFPWWAFLASGKDGDNLGQQVFNTLSNVLKTKHDTVKNTIGNIR